MPKTTPKTRRARTKKEVELDAHWGKEAAKIIKAAMARKGVNAPQLAEMLTEYGRPTAAQPLRNLLSNGQFKAAWFLDVLNLLGEKDVSL
jgi:hypothetical protein